MITYHVHMCALTCTCIETSPNVCTGRPCINVYRDEHCRAASGYAITFSWIGLVALSSTLVPSIPVYLVLLIPLMLRDGRCPPLCMHLCALWLVSLGAAARFPNTHLATLAGTGSWQLLLGEELGALQGIIFTWVHRMDQNKKFDSGDCWFTLLNSSYSISKFTCLHRVDIQYICNDLHPYWNISLCLHREAIHLQCFIPITK